MHRVHWSWALCQLLEKPLGARSGLLLATKLLALKCAVLGPGWTGPCGIDHILAALLLSTYTSTLNSQQNNAVAWLRRP
eukprot:4643129-Amphidinium_carterae.1